MQSFAGREVNTINAFRVIALYCCLCGSVGGGSLRGNRLCVRLASKTHDMLCWGVARCAFDGLGSQGQQARGAARVSAQRFCGAMCVASALRQRVLHTFI